MSSCSVPRDHGALELMGFVLIRIPALTLTQLCDLGKAS